ncbi:unnamed protein product [Phytophthora lilii]|uniref:Unnamed protein product n=1 Tax=Phytophthora lilii TaxID=2077276 RepID=A0A9W7D9A1_9STRA|nr:unnamed protein product [Phytophthora lilii]
MWGAKVKMPCDMEDDVLEDAIKHVTSRLAKYDTEEWEKNGLAVRQRSASRTPTEMLSTCNCPLQLVAVYHLDVPLEMSFECCSMTHGCSPTVFDTEAIAAMATHVAKKMKLEHEPVGAEADAAIKSEEPNASDEEEEDESATSAIAQFQSEDVSGS